MKDKSDFKVGAFTIHFAEAYMALYEKGEITDDQLEKVTNLLDRMEDYPPGLFKERLEKIFDTEIE